MRQIFLLISLLLLCSSSIDVSAQQSETGRGSLYTSSSNDVLLDDTQIAAMQLLRRVSVNGVTLGMPIGEAIGTLESEAYSLNPNPQLGNGGMMATFHLGKGKVASTGEDREHFSIQALMDKPHDPRRPYIFSPDWPVLSLKYVLQDQENIEKIKSFTGYDWSDTPAQTMQEVAYATLCPAATSADYACRTFEAPNGFVFERIQVGKPVRIRALFSGAGNGRYQVILRDELADTPAPRSRQSSKSRSR